MVEKEKEISFEEYNSSAPFNMALFTLQKIHNILRMITTISSTYIIDEEGEKFLAPGKSQHLKYKLVKQLYIQAIPLFDKKTTGEWKKETLKKIRAVSLKVGGRYMNKKLVARFPCYEDKIDNELDDLTIEIQEKLQDEGYFMPPKTDIRHLWRER